MLVLKLLTNAVNDGLVKVMGMTTDIKESYSKAVAINHNLQVLEAKLKQKPKEMEFMDFQNYDNNKKE